MKSILLTVALCAAIILCMSSTAMAKLFIVEIDGEKIGVDFYVESEQTWQNTPQGAPGYWEGLAWRPDPDYGTKIWYPFLSDTFDMTLDEQLEWIEDLEYAGIKDWRIGYYWDTIPMKASMFGGMQLGLPGPNRVFDFDSSVYFPPTACGIGGFGGYQCIYLGRTGNEDGLTNGAIINAMMGFPAPIDPSYIADGVVAKEGMGGFPNYYTLPRSLAQDHWISFEDMSLIFNDDLNGNPDDTTIGLMSAVDEVTGKQPIGAWTVTESIPELSPAVCGKEFHTISISDVINPGVAPVLGIDEETGDPIVVEKGISAGTLVSVADVEIFQDEPVGDSGPDAKVIQAAETTYIRVRAERDEAGNGRVYHISFTDSVGGKYTFKVGVPKEDTLVDDGDFYDSRKVADAGGPYEGVVGQPIIFDASGSRDYDPDGKITWYFWLWTDEQTWFNRVPSPVFEYRYWSEYSGYVTLMVMFDDGLLVWDTAWVEIKAP